jgi:hypothetical protein
MSEVFYINSERRKECKTFFRIVKTFSRILHKKCGHSEKTISVQPGFLKTLNRQTRQFFTITRFSQVQNYWSSLNKQFFILLLKKIRQKIISHTPLVSCFFVLLSTSVNFLFQQENSLRHSYFF